MASVLPMDFAVGLIHNIYDKKCVQYKVLFFKIVEFEVYYSPTFTAKPPLKK